MTGLWRAQTSSGRTILIDRKSFESEDFEKLEVICPSHSLVIEHNKILFDNNMLGLYFVIDGNDIPVKITNTNKPIPYTREAHMFNGAGELVKRLSPEAGCKIQKGLVIGGRRFNVGVEFFTDNDQFYVIINPRGCFARITYQQSTILILSESLYLLDGNNVRYIPRSNPE